MAVSDPPFGQVDIVGIGWYRRGDWDALRALFVDRHVLPATYDDWLARAEALERQLEASGKRVVRAEIRPRTFGDWCQRTGRAPDAAARTAWGNEIALAEYRKGH